MNNNHELVKQFLKWNMTKEIISYREQLFLERIVVRINGDKKIDIHKYISNILDSQILFKGVGNYETVLSWLGGIDGEIEWCGLFFPPKVGIKGNKLLIAVWKDGERGDKDPLEFLHNQMLNQENINWVLNKLSIADDGLTIFTKESKPEPKPEPKPKTKPEPKTEPKAECCICLEECKIKWTCQTCKAGLICGGCKKSMKGVKSCPVCRTKPLNKK